MTAIIILALVYILAYPLVLRIVTFLHRKLFIDGKIKRAKKKKKKIDESKLPDPIWPKMRKLLLFAFKDSRGISFKKGGTSPIQRRFIYLGLWAAGLISTIISIALSHFSGTWFLIGIMFFTSFIIFGIFSSRDIIKIRDKLIYRMFEVASSKLGQSSEYARNPGQVVRVKDWRDYIKPQKVEFDVPTTFSDESEEGFLRQYNQIFGRETAWVPDSTPDQPGWDYEKGIVTLRAVPPLPMKAPWSEHYVLDDAVAWSFFPLALGVENGLELTNPETGEKENVLGFDLSDEQADLAKKMGVNVASKIVTSPMVLIAGGTGGGKAWDSETDVLVLDDEDILKLEKGEDLWE